MCDSRISLRSPACTPAYHTFSGYTTTMGPWPHCEKQPALLTRTSPWRFALHAAAERFHERLHVALGRTGLAARTHEHVSVVLAHRGSSSAELVVADVGGGHGGPPRHKTQARVDHRRRPSHVGPDLGEAPLHVVPRHRVHHAARERERRIRGTQRLGH